MYRSTIEGDPESDIVYYNADIINNITSATGTGTGADPTIRFQETRDAPIVRDASKYNFSIVRFTMTGPNKDLPLFIPSIELNRTGVPQTDPNRTVYSLAIAYQRTWTTTNQPGGITFTVTPLDTPVIYRPETQNINVAPVPIVPVGGITQQDLSTRYYWVYTYRHWLDLVNETLLQAMENVRTTFAAQWAAAGTGDAFPYPTLASFLADHDAPYLTYDEETFKFSIYGDTRAFNVRSQITGANDIFGQPIGVGQPVPAFVAPAGPNPQPSSAPYLRLFFDANLYGLFTNFKNTYYETFSLRFPLTPTVLTTLPAGADYTNEILFTNENYTNILNNNPLLQGSQAVPPPAYNPLFLIPSRNQVLYWKETQDYPSTDSLWSPIGSIVFLSTLLPVRNEFIGEPVRFGEGNIGFSQPSVPSAFLPIVTDLSIDTADFKAHGYREAFLYNPTAEYRMASMGPSKQEIRNVDVSVYWKNRLDGSINPISMFNLSSVSIKMMFRKVGAGSQ